MSGCTCPVYTELDPQWERLRSEQRTGKDLLYVVEYSEDPAVNTSPTPVNYKFGIAAIHLDSVYSHNPPVTNKRRQQSCCFARGKHCKSCLGKVKPAERESTGEVQQRLLTARQVCSHLGTGFARYH